MNNKKKLTALLASILLASPIISNTVVINHATQAATFTNNEASLVQNLQNQYSSLNTTPYTINNLYRVAPHLTAPFSSGVLSQTYINEQLSWINYYRKLFDLPAITATPVLNKNAQTAASVMAAINANTFQSQHGLPNDIKPAYISNNDWNIAKDTTANSNLNFNVTNESAGNVVTDLITDSYNLTGQDTGHRAWLLSPWLSTTGIGAAYGTNGYRYSVQRVINISDALNSPTQNTISYPSNGVFPIELLQGQNIAWSLYLTNRSITGTPKITITDLDTGQTSSASNIRNYSSNYYGNFSTILTYYPGDIKLISGHQYQVNIAGVYQYTFKLFNQVKSHQPSISVTTHKETIPDKNNIISSKTIVNNDFPMVKDTDVQDIVENQQSDIKIKSELLMKAESIRDSLMKQRLINNAIFGKSYQDGKSFYNLGTYQWFSEYYKVENPNIHAGILNVTNTMLDRHIYNSPYWRLQKSSQISLAPQSSYPYGQSIHIGNITWYYLGPYQWVKQLSNNN